MNTVRWSVWVVGFLLISCCLFGAEEHYPRIWENETWVEENPHANYFFSELFIGSGEVHEGWLESLLNQSIPTFQDGLEEMKLDELNTEGDQTDSTLGEAIIYRNWAREISWGVEDIVGVKLAWDIWNYPGNWKNCVDYSLTSLETWGGMLNAKNTELSALQEKFVMGGACDYDYVGFGAEYCTVLSEDVECDYSGIYEDIPEFGWYYGCTHEHWDAISGADGKISELYWAYDSAELLCEETISEVTAKQSLAQERIQELEAQELDHIYKGVGGSGNSESLGLRNNYEELLEAKTLADTAAASAVFGGKNKGRNQWMKKCIMNGETAIAAYSEILDWGILEEAEEIVDGRGEDAHLALDTALGMEEQMGLSAKSMLGMAENACASGDGVDHPLGVRFDEYSKCVLYAKLALDSVVEGEDVIAAQRKVDLEYVNALIDSAKADGIDTLSEERLVAGMVATNHPGYLEIIENIREGLAAKAESKYGHLPKERKELLEWISNAGDSFEYLSSWFEGEDCYSMDTLDYLCAIGTLRGMSESYEDIFMEIDANRDIIVGKALFVEYSEEIGVVMLDSPGEAYLYVQITNPLPFSGEGVVLEISTDFDFRKIDLIENSEKVKAVLDKQGGIEIYLSEIEALETIELVFKKEEIICRTKTYEETAYGDSDGGASVSQELKVECSSPVRGLVLGEMFEGGEITLNGMELGAESVGRIAQGLPAGTHKVVIESYDYGAYNVDREVSFVSTVGLETKVELFFVFHPNRDLDYITFTSVEKGKNLDSLEIFGYTGERIQDKKVLGENTIFFKVNDLLENREVKVRVSYGINNLEDFVDGAILEYSSRNLTGSEEILLEEAKTSVFGNNYPNAYTRLEELRGLLEKREKQHTKAIEKHEQISEKIRERIAELESVVSLAKELGLENGYVTEINARLGDLKESLELEVGEDALIGPLESFDLGWEKRELTKISKELMSLERDLKERWVGLGVESSEMEGLIEEIEMKNSEFAGTLAFEDAILAFSLLEEGEELLTELREEKAAVLGEERVQLELLVEDAYSLWEKYAHEYDMADGTHLEGLFPMAPKEISKELKEISESGRYDEGKLRVEELKGRMEETIRILEEEGIRLEESVLSLYTAYEGEMNEVDSGFIVKVIDDSLEYRSMGEYVLTIKSLEIGMDRLENLGGRDEGTLVLAITGLLILGVIGLYLAKDKFPRYLFPQAIGGGGKGKKEYRKLKRENQ